MARQGFKEIRLGCLWGILLPLVYTVIFIVVLFLLPHEPVPDNLSWQETISVILKLGVFGILSLVIYAVLLIPVLVLGIILGLKDPSMMKTLKVSWPFLLAFLYIILPDPLPGPVDDVVVTFIASSIGALLLSKELKKRKEEAEKEFDRDSPDTLEVEVLPKKEQSTAIEKPKEIIDVEFEEKS